MFAIAELQLQIDFVTPIFRVPFLRQSEEAKDDPMHVRAIITRSSSSFHEERQRQSKNSGKTR